MEINILKERETPLLSRKRVTIEVIYPGATPSRLELIKEIAAKLKVNPVLVILKHIYTKFGKRKAKIIAHVYNNEKDLKLLETDVLLKKHSEKKEVKEGEEEAGKK